MFDEKEKPEMTFTTCPWRWLCVVVICMALSRNLYGQVENGCTREQVIAAKGNPTITMKKGAQEYLEFRDGSSVTIEGGKVIQCGANAPKAVTAAPSASAHAVAQGNRVRRTYVTATFVEVIPGGVFRYRLQNVSGKDIRDFKGVFKLYDEHGELLGSTGLAFATKEGWLANGATYNGNVSVDAMTQDGASLLGKLRRWPDKIQFVVEASAITYMDGTQDAALSN